MPTELMEFQNYFLNLCYCLMLTSTKTKHFSILAAGVNNTTSTDGDTSVQTAELMTQGKYEQILSVQRELDGTKSNHSAFYGNSL